MATKKQNSKSSIPHNAPLTAFDKARIVWYERYGSAIVEKNRYFVLLAFAVIMIIALAFAIAVMAPLKTVVPYYIKVMTDGSAVVDTNSVGTNDYKPGESEKRYFLANWVNRLLTIDSYLIKKNITQNYLQTSGKATNELADFLRETKPVEIVTEDPTVTQTVKINGINFLQDDAALVKVTTVRRTRDKTDTKSWLVTLHFVLIPPTNPDEILKNPIGLFVTHFDVAAEIN
jgi:type IV secretory pathway TrbF-like protein